MKYVFMTDVSCDLTQKQVDEIGVAVIPMEFQIEDKCYMHYPDCRMMKLDEFYNIIDEGAYPKTTQINIDSFKPADFSFRGKQRRSYRFLRAIR